MTRSGIAQGDRHSAESGLRAITLCSNLRPGEVGTIVRRHAADYARERET
jgi:hypothetical protein